MLLGEVDRGAALRLIAARAREVAEADLAVLLTYDEERHRLHVEVGSGRLPDGVLGGALRDAHRETGKKACSGEIPPGSQIGAIAHSALERTADEVA